MTGGIPTALGSIPSLEFLDIGMWILQRIMIHICIIHWWYDSNTFFYLFGVSLLLYHMTAGSNAFTGTIPSELGELGVLKVLKVSVNALTGPIPTEIGNIEGLVSLGLGK